MPVRGFEDSGIVAAVGECALSLLDLARDLDHERDLDHAHRIHRRVRIDRDFLTRFAANGAAS